MAQVAVTVAYPSMVFTSRRAPGTILALFTMKADGSHVAQLTFNPERDFRAEYSRDGSRIAFTSDRDGPGSILNFEVYTMLADGSNQTRLTFDPDFDDNPTWSPDGSKIAFASNRGGEEQGSIYVMDANGTNLVRLTTDHGQQPAWSPDGSKIAFTASRNSTGLLIWVMNADGSNQHPLTAPDALTNQGDGEPAWSPDGSKIAFTSRRHGGNPSGTHIYTANADGSNITEITHGILDANPAWSPEGSGMAFAASTGDPDEEIWIVNADGSAQMRLTSNAGVDLEPAWKP
jgi:Tol biopolymer transport system component